MTDTPRQPCDAETGKPGAWHGCRRRSTVTIVTVLGSVLHYCEAHKDRADDPDRRYHSPTTTTL